VAFVLTLLFSVSVYATPDCGKNACPAAPAEKAAEPADKSAGKPAARSGGSWRERPFGEGASGDCKSAGKSTAVGMGVAAGTGFAGGAMAGAARSGNVVRALGGGVLGAGMAMATQSAYDANTKPLEKKCKPSHLTLPPADAQYAGDLPNY